MWASIGRTRLQKHLCGPVQKKSVPWCGTKAKELEEQMIYNNTYKLHCVSGRYGTNQTNLIVAPVSYRFVRPN